MIKLQSHQAIRLKRLLSRNTEELRFHIITASFPTGQLMQTVNLPLS